MIKTESLASEILTGGLLGGTLSAPRSKECEFDRIRIRPIMLASEKSFQLEQFKNEKVFHKNMEQSKMEEYLSSSLGTVFGKAEFSTVSEIFRVMTNRRGEITVLRQKRSLEQTSTPNAPEVHNRKKKYILEEGIPVPFLIDLGIMTQDGTVIQSKYDKFRQINRFLEYIADILPELKKNKPDNQELTVVDFGCGKSYLTFAVYYFLTILSGIQTRIYGLDLKEDVIQKCSLLAEKYSYSGLTFSVGDIAGYTGVTTADLVISLHACDTATDFAIAQAVRWNTKVILAVPCCQHELNAQLADKSRNMTTENNEPNVTKKTDLHVAEAHEDALGRSILEPAFRYGLVRERMAALFTDSLRAELLTSCGYKVQLLEFIDIIHTPKNILIRAVLEKPQAELPVERKVSPQYTELRNFLGVVPRLEKELF